MTKHTDETSGYLCRLKSSCGVYVLPAIVQAQNHNKGLTAPVKKICLTNCFAGLGPRVVVLKNKVEELEEVEKVDVLVSEPMGTLLVNERMLETYIYARDHFLKPGGKMFPVKPLAPQVKWPNLQLYLGQLDLRFLQLPSLQV